MILVNQFEILRYLAELRPEGPEGGATYDVEEIRTAQHALSTGYEFLINEAMPAYQDEPLSLEKQEWVLNVLIMWDRIQRSFDELEDRGQLTEGDVAFSGWDGNSLDGELWFAKAFCYPLGDSDEPATRFESIRPRPAFNSNGPYEAGYGRMLVRYNEIMSEILRGPFRNLTHDEIVDILGRRAGN